VTSGPRVAANLATLANGLLGVGAILYTLAGNKLWAMLLIGCGIGFDGLDGLLSRRAGGPPSSTGRILDSVADAITFGLAPGFLVAVHTEHASLWAPWGTYALLVGAFVVALAWGRLVYFTWRGWARPHFVGASTPQNALALIVLILFFDAPGFFGTNPTIVLVGTAVALGVCLVPLQFRPAMGTPFYILGEVAAIAAAIGLAGYYIVGPLMTGGSVNGPDPGVMHG
jgi:phosphatidylserine synthase